LWRDKYCVALCPDQLVAIRCGGGLRSAVDFKICETLAPLPGEPAWAAAAEALRRFLATPEAGAGDLSIVLSNHFVRYMLVPWSGRIASVEEFRNYAEVAFEEVYGEAAVQWEVCSSPERAGAPRLAAAVDRALLAAVRAAVGRTRLRLRSVQPYLMAAYNRVVRPRPERDFVFALIEADRVCILTAEDGTWRQVSAVNAPADPAALVALLEREIRLAGLQGDAALPVFVHAAQSPGFTLPPFQGKAPQMLELKSMAGLAPTRGAAYAMVASVV
jgi:hypothetical protein